MGIRRPALLPDRADADLQRLSHFRVPEPEERKRQSEGTVLRCSRQQDRERHPPGAHRR